MYYPYFIAYMAIGFAFSLIVLFWAIRRGQFKDQERVRFLPLEEARPSPNLRVSRFNRFEAYVLGAIVLLGLSASGAVFVFSLLFGGQHG